VTESERHVQADYQHPVAVAERQLESRLAAMRASGEFDQPKSRSRPRHVYAHYRCLTCGRSEIRCRAENL
jgi:hypothetical protein